MNSGPKGPEDKGGKDARDKRPQKGRPAPWRVKPAATDLHILPDLSRAREGRLHTPRGGTAIDFDPGVAAPVKQPDVDKRQTFAAIPEAPTSNRAAVTINMVPLEHAAVMGGPQNDESTAKNDLTATDVLAPFSGPMASPFNNTLAVDIVPSENVTPFAAPDDPEIVPQAERLASPIPALDTPTGVRGFTSGKINFIVVGTVLAAATALSIAAFVSPGRKGAEPSPTGASTASAPALVASASTTSAPVAATAQPEASSTAESAEKAVSPAPSSSLSAPKPVKKPPVPALPQPPLRDRMDPNDDPYAPPGKTYL